MNIYSFEGYIFDLDGTLLDSMEVWRKIYAAPFKEAGMSMPKNLLEQINHLSLNDSARLTVERTGLPFSPSELVQKWTGTARWVYAHDVRLKEGAKELLLELYRRGKRIGIATANPQGIFEACLKKEGIADLFMSATSVDEVPRGKGFPDIYREEARRLGLSAGECLVFEDSHMGVRGAKDGGFAVVGVYDKQSEKFAAQMQKECDAYVRSLAELIE